MKKNDALTKIADQLIVDQDTIIAENAKDLAYGEEQGMPVSTLDRIMLNKERIEAMANAIHLLVKLEDPVGNLLEKIEKDNGLLIEKRLVQLALSE